MKRLSWIVTLPLLVIVIVFSVANRHLVTIDLWPFALTQPIPLSWLVLGAAFVGFVIGALVMWLSGAGTRRRARMLDFDKTHLQREVLRLRREVERAKAPPAARPASGSASVPQVRETATS